MTAVISDRGVVLVEREPGIGKSLLLGEAVGEAALGEPFATLTANDPQRDPSDAPGWWISQMRARWPVCGHTGDNSAGTLGNGSLTRSTAQVAVGALGGSRASPQGAPMDSPCAPTARPPSGVLIPHAGELHG